MLVNLASLLFFFYAYFMGAIPCGYIFARFFYGIDITKNGSGNIGASNAGRLLGYSSFFLVLLLDAGKAFLTLYLLSFFATYTPTNNWPLIASLGLLLGNAYSCFLNFRGGKGVATALGILAYLFPVPFSLIFMLIWITVSYCTKRASLGSLAALMLTSLLIISWYAYALTDEQCAFILVLNFFILWRHRKNL